MALTMEELIKTAIKEKQLVLGDSFNELSHAMNKSKHELLVETQNRRMPPEICTMPQQRPHKTLSRRV